jgi:PAS domain S-box-containing protein
VTPFPGTGPRRAVVAHEDITVRKESEAAVRKSERELRYVISAIFEGLWDWDLVNDSAHCNAQWYQMLGYEPDEFPVSRKSLLQLTHPEDRDLVRKAHEAFFQSVDAVPYTSVFRLLRKDGSYAWIWSSGSVVERGDDGKPVRMMGVHSDVTEKMEAGDALRSSEERYRQLFESMHAGFALHEIICDGNGVPYDYCFLEVNSAFETLAGLTAEQMIGKRGREVVPWIASRWIDLYGKVALTGVPARIDDFSGTPGRYYSVSVYSPKRGQFAAVFSDVTEQRNAQEVVRKARDAAEEANRAKTQLLANMSHELRTPLNAIIGLTELLKDSSLDEEQLDYVKIISNSGESLLNLISDLFDFSAIGSGAMKLHNESLSVRKIIDQTLASFLPQAASRGIELTGTVHADVPEAVGGDSKRVQQVLTCLVQNAFKFTKKGFVRLSVKSATVSSGSHRIEFTVEDSGSGMNPVTMRRLFDSFQQGDNSNTREYGGAGLGLSISKKLIELMGGTIEVESREGQGSTFRFYILDRFVNKNGGGNGGGGAGLLKLLKGCRVCIWSDDPADMHLAESLLERCGAIPFYKESLAEIIESETDGIPTDVILCNLDFTEISGRLEELRKIRPGIPWIAFSRWMTPLTAGDERCFSAFIDRPLEESQLYNVLERLLGKQK